MESSPDLVHPIRSVGWQQSGGSRDGQPDATDRQSREEGNSVRYWCCSTVRQWGFFIPGTYAYVFSGHRPPTHQATEAPLMT